MAYVCELHPDHHLYLDNQGNQTIVTTILVGQGQQQQASNSMTTGAWTALPQVYRIPGGVKVKILTLQGNIWITLQGNQVAMVGTMGGETAGDGMSDADQEPLSVQQVATSSAQTQSTMPMAPMAPMAPMPPMTMQMGNMELKMDSMSSAPSSSQATSSSSSSTTNSASTSSASTNSASTNAASSATPSAASRRFCSQCGAKVAAEDRFCSSCGHRLG